MRGGDRRTRRWIAQILLPQTALAYYTTVAKTSAARGHQDARSGPPPPPPPPPPRRRRYLGGEASTRAQVDASERAADARHAKHRREVARTAVAHGPVDAVRPSGFTSGTVVKAKKEDAEAEEEEDATSVREKRSEAVTAEAE